MGQLGFSLNMLRRDWRSGALRLIFFSLVIAVASMSSVNFFIDRVDKSLRLNANELLAADLVVRADHAIPDAFIQLASQSGLQQANARTFRSMALADGRNQLAEVKAVDNAYPLRGQLKITQTLYGQEQTPESIPGNGEAWVEPELFMRLKLKLGDSITLGKSQFTVTAILAYEPDRGSGMFNIAPRVLLNLDDLAATGLVQEGSRIRYHLLLAGAIDSVKQYQGKASTMLARGEQLIEVTEARDEVREALSRAQRFLGLAALVAMILAAVAMAMAVRTYVQRHFDHCAVMRCIGASQGFVFRVYMMEMLWLAILAGVFGSLLGYIGHAVLIGIASEILAVDLPAASWLPFGYGIATSIVLVLVFILPSLLQLKNVPTMRVIRRELGTLKATTLTAVLTGTVLVAFMLVWLAKDVRLGLYLFGGLAGSIVLLALVSWLFLLLIRQLRDKVGVSWRFGLVSLSRRSRASVAQVTAFGIGIMALLLMSFVTNDLLRQWKDRLPPDTPNRFIINIQQDQLDGIRQFFQEEGVAPPELYPMVRGRLQMVNGNPVSADDYENHRAQHLVEREFNLSWAKTLQAGNKIVQGEWWNSERSIESKNQLSLEEGIAETLGLNTGDRMTFSIAGEQFEMTVANLRSVAWDSFRVNFFAIAAPGALENYPASYITSFYLPSDNQGTLNRLVQAFPNLTVIDISSIMNKVRSIILRVTDAIQYVFLFTLVAGLVVLYAAILATHDERAKECAMLRTFGADRKQLVKGLLSEFITLGFLSGLVAALTSTILAYVLANEVMEMSYQFDLLIWLIGPIGGALGVGLAGYLGIKPILKQAPIQILRKLSTV